MNVDLQITRGNNSTEVQERPVSPVLKAWAANGIEQRHLFLLYQSVLLSVIDNGLGLTTVSQTNLLKLDQQSAKRGYESHTGNHQGHAH